MYSSRRSASSRSADGLCHNPLAALLGGGGWRYTRGVGGRSLPDFAIGARLFVGGYGTVHRGVGPVGEEIFALVVAPELAERTRFEEELRSANRVLSEFRHSHAISSELVDRDPSGRLIQITSPVDEPTALASVLRAGGRPPAPVAMALSRELIAALAAAHEHGIIHGAVHPRSVFIDGEGRAMIGDFAPARALAETAAADDVELFEGVRPYLAPEIDYGEGPSVAADVYGLGALLFELWAGRPPPGDIAGPAEVRRVIERALRSDPVARLGSAGELAAELSRAASGAGLLPAPPWQVAAWVREHVEARKHGAEAHLQAARLRDRDGRSFDRVPDVAPKPRASQLSIAAAAARARGRADGAGIGQRTPTPLADARDVLGATSASDALSRVDAALANYDRGADAPPEASSSAGEDTRRRLSGGEIFGFALALFAVLAIGFALVASWRAASSDDPEVGADTARIVSSESRLVS